MKKQILMLLGGAFLLPMFAMAASSFAGSWLQDSKSDRVPEPMWLTRAVPNGRGGRGGGPGRGAPAEPIMTIEQNATTLTATDPAGIIRKFTLDGKPATVTAETHMAKTTTTAALQGDNLVVTTNRPYGGMPGNVGLEVKEVWSLSPDGKTLTITTTHNSPAVKKSYKQTFTRK